MCPFQGNMWNTSFIYIYCEAIDRDGEEKIVCLAGAGAIDAAYKAMNQIMKVNCFHIFVLTLM